MAAANTDRRGYRLHKLMRKMGWHKAAHDGRITGRIYTLTGRPRPWWDWGHRVMVLVGVPFGGSYSEPTPTTWWYDVSGRDTVRLVKSYTEYRAASADDRENTWHWIGWDQDHQLRLGYYQSEKFYGLDRVGQKLLRQWMRAWRRKDGYGLRTWLYYKALHAAVNERVPFTCQAVPSRDSGGYSHWHCSLKRRHVGEHRFRNYVWAEQSKAEFSPLSAHQTPPQTLHRTRLRTTHTQHVTA